MRSAQSPQKRVLAPRVIENFEDIETEADALAWLKDNDDIAHDEVNELIRSFPDMFRLVPYMVENEYERDLTLESNRRSWINEYEKTKGINWWEDDSDRFFVRILDDDGATTSEADNAEKLDDYPVFDENDHSDLEMETQAENWNEYGRQELRDKIEEEANEVDAEAIERLMLTIDDETLDKYVHAIWEDKGEYPEQEQGGGTIFPKILAKWDGSVLELGDLFSLADHGYTVAIQLTPAAFDRNGRLLLRPQDVPRSMRALIDNPKSTLEIPYEGAICDSPYFTCTWTGGKEEPQLKLPGVAERRKRRS